MPQIYIMISQTHTRFAYLIRKLGKTRYNHAAISLDAELEELYAFARPQHKAVLLARLTRENVFRYCLGLHRPVNVVIFRVEVGEEQYSRVKALIAEIKNDPAYVYNLLSVLSYPFLKGFHLDKSFTCIEFVMYVLLKLGYELPKAPCRYRPDELLEMFGGAVHYSGDLLAYKPCGGDELGYFSPMTARQSWDSLKALSRMFRRIGSCRKKPKLSSY